MIDFDLVIFDCDGVVADSEVLSCHCVIETLRKYGLVMDLDEVVERFLGRSSSTIAAHYQRVLGRPLPPTFAVDYRTCLATLFHASLRPVPNVREVLEHLDQPYCLASSSDMERIRLTLSLTQLGSYFDGNVFTADMVNCGKPAPDLFLFIAERMGVRPHRTLVVEDAVPGIEAGKAAGMTVWGFTGGSHYIGRDIQPRLLAAGADRVFDSMVEFLPNEK